MADHGGGYDNQDLEAPITLQPIELDDMNWGALSSIPSKMMQYYVVGPEQMRLKVIAPNATRAESYFADLWDAETLLPTTIAGTPSQEYILKWFDRMHGSIEAYKSKWEERAAAHQPPPHPILDLGSINEMELEQGGLSDGDSSPFLLSNSLLIESHAAEDLHV